MSSAPTVWGLDTGRPGEYMQVAALGQALGLGFERVRLSPEGSPTSLPATPPCLILSFGRSARVALCLAQACSPRPLLVQMGTPGHLPAKAFDVIIPMPQDDYPAEPNVVFPRLPLNGATEEPPPPRNPPKRCTILLGGPSRHFLLSLGTGRRMLCFGLRLAAANGEPLTVVCSPRTPAKLMAELQRLAAAWRFTLIGYGEIPFSDILQTSTRFVVTADSASMLGEACRTGAPVWLFSLPLRPNLAWLQRGIDRCFGRPLRHLLVRLGWLGGGTDFRRWHRQLERSGVIRTARTLPDPALRWTPRIPFADHDLRLCRRRILERLAAKVLAGRPAAPLPFGGDSVSRKRP